MTGYQSRSYVQLGGDLGAVYAKNMEARDKVRPCGSAQRKAYGVRHSRQPPLCGTLFQRPSFARA